MPVSTAMNGGIAACGLTRVWNSPSTSPPRTLTAPISVIIEPAVGRAAGGLEVDDAERDVAQRAAELVEAALRLPAGGRGGRLLRSSATTLGPATDTSTQDARDRLPGAGSGRGRASTTLRTVTVHASRCHPPLALRRLRQPDPLRRHPDAAGRVSSGTSTSPVSTRVEETEVRDETVESVTCRWCGRADAIELVARAEAADAPS